MALSNWDTLAVGLDGKPQSGFFVSPGGVEVSIYKNWIYVRDPKAWRDGGHFVKDTIMEINHGSVQYHDVEIQAVRGPQSGVYVVCWHVNYGNGSDEPTKYTGMIGCGVSGYEDEGWVGVKPESVEFLQKWISNKERMFSDEEVEKMMTELNNPDLDPKEWKKELLESYSFDFPKEIAGVTLEQGIRYNQGNMYFTEKIGTPLDATKPGGSSEEPVIMSMIGGADEDEAADNDE